MEKTTLKQIQKNQLQLDQLIRDDEAMQKFLDQLDDMGIEDSFSQVYKQLDTMYETLTESLSRVDPQLRKLTQENKQWIVQRIDSLHQKSLQYSQQKHEVAIRQVQKAIASVKPNQKLQERVYTILPFLIKYGPDFVDKLRSEFKDGHFEFWNVYL